MGDGTLDVDAISAAIVQCFADSTATEIDTSLGSWDVERAGSDVTAAL